MSVRIALENKISTTTLANLIASESGWRKDAIGDNGCSFGLTQQNICAHPEIKKEEALDPATAIAFAARDIAAGKEAKYTVCNCYSYVSLKVKGLPRMEAIIPNGSPKIGSVAIFEYKDKRTGMVVKHIAYIEKLSESGFTVSETNFSKCLLDERKIAWTDPRLVGFYNS